MKCNFTIARSFRWSEACAWGVAIGLFSALVPLSAHADETPFSYLYTTESQPRGHWEYEQWNTLRSGKAAGTYNSFDLDQEIEHGFTDNFQASFYLHSSFLHTHDTYDPDDLTQKLPDQSAFDVNGVSVELKYRVLNSLKDPLGLSLYLEPELGVRNKLTGADVIERALESKIILDKPLFDDRLILDANITFEPEWEIADGEHSKELKNEYGLGASWRWAPRWFGGLECLNRRVFDHQSLGDQKVSTFFLGPAIHYGAERWWASFTVLPQIGGTPTALGADANGNVISDGYRSLGEYEKMEIRLKFGIDF